MTTTRGRNIVVSSLCV